MDYPEWAPEVLVDQHKFRTEGDQSKRRFKAPDPEETLAKLIQNHGKPLSDENIESLRQQLYRQAMLGGLPDKEGTALLEKLITDLNMKNVWTALSKRSENNPKKAAHFFHACEHAIMGWRAHPKQTGAEQRVFYQEIYDTAAKLQSLMIKASDFGSYSITKLIDDKSTEWLLESLGASLDEHIPNGQEISYAQFCLSDVMPSIFDVLKDIAEKAKEYRDRELVVKKPNSLNAEVHYFIRILSAHCQHTYNQPLHEVVAITTSVIFDLPNCDDDYVRKIVNS